MTAAVRLIQGNIKTINWREMGDGKKERDGE